MSKGDKAKAGSNKALHARATEPEQLHARAIAVPGQQLSLSDTLKNYIEQHNLLPKFGDESPAHRRQQLHAACKGEAAAQVIKGYWLAEILAVEGRAAMLQAATENHIGARSADYAVAQFRLFNSIGDLNAIEALSTLDPTKLRALPLDAESAVAFARGEEIRGITIDQAREMNTRDLAEAVKSRDDEINRLQGQNASLEEHLKATRNQLNQEKTAAALRAQKSGLPAFAFAARQELAAASDTVEVALDLVTENIAALADEAKKDRRHAGIVAGTAYHLLNAIDARVQQLQERLQKAFAPECSSEPAGFAMEPGEAEGAIKAREVILGRIQDAAHDRAAARANSAEGRVGRKRKTAAEKKAR